MAHIETWYRCPCGAAYDTQREALHCSAAHVRSERWAVGKSGKAVRIFENCAPNGRGGENWALREADLSDNVEERRRQLKETEENEKCSKTETKIIYL